MKTESPTSMAVQNQKKISEGISQPLPSPNFGTMGLLGASWHGSLIQKYLALRNRVSQALKLPEGALFLS